MTGLERRPSDHAPPEGVPEAERRYGPIEHKIRRFASALLRDPVETLLYVPEHWLMRHDRWPELDAAADWERRLHDLIGAEWPCGEREEVHRLWGEIGAELSAKGLSVGRNTYRGYSDGDAALAEAVWCAARHLSPSVVLETGVARGVTSRVLLEALERNGAGELWSIDLPHPFDASLHEQTGVAVPERLRRRWHYVRGSSRRRLDGVLRRVGNVELFVHDSLHTTRNTSFELEHVAGAMRRGGLVVVDDANMNEGFSRFLEAHAGVASLVCPSADDRGVFAVGRLCEGSFLRQP